MEAEKKNSKTLEYGKKYYQENKEHIKDLIKKSHQKKRLRDLVNKLNGEGKFDRFPHSRIAKYGIKKNDDGLYYI